MTLLELIVLIVVVGVILWAVNTYVPMAAPIKTILNLVVILVLLLWILNAFGIFSGPLNRPIR